MFKPKLSSTHRLRYLLWGLVVLLWSASVAAVEVIKSPNDDRQYQYLVLPNDLKVLLISDPDTDKAAASLDVGVGSANDPAGRQGLAHFLEHMLFLGTEKYPQAEEYQNFISARGGNHNAYTAFEDTNFHFDIDKDHLEPALDRFSQFFVSPLFTAEYVTREKNAVNSEYQARIKEDDRRAYSVLQQLINPEHPMSQFSVGSLETLADRDGSRIRDELIGFYQTHYSSNLMTLVVLGREPLPVLERWVTERFSQVLNRHAAIPPIRAPLIRDRQLPVRVNITPLKDERLLQIFFPTPPIYQHYRVKPTDYLANLLGHEGAGSLLSMLKERGWADEVTTGTGLDDRNEAAFLASVKLTRSGLEHVDEVIAEVFAYIRLIREQGLTAWRYEEQSKLSSLSFQFGQKHEPLDYVTSLAEELQYVDPADAIRSPYLMAGYDENLIRSYLNRLTPENAVVAVMAKGLAVNKRDPWYDTPYGVSRPAPEQLARWRQGAVDAALKLPEPNPFIPDHTALKPLEPDATPVPAKVQADPGFELWFKQDGAYHQPRADFYFSVRSTLANDTAAHAVLTDLYTRIVSDQLNEFSYPATMAGLSYRVYPHIRGFSVRISGFDDKQKLLLERVAESLRHPQIRDERFAVIKDAFLRELDNVRRENPYEQTGAEITKLMVKPGWSEAQRITAGRTLTAEDLRQFVPKLLEAVQVIAMAHGNLQKQDALDLGAVLKTKFADPARSAEVPGGRVVQLRPGDRYSRELTIDHPDSSVVAYFQGDDRTAENRARFDMLAQVLDAPFYNDLRTEKQLGYIVNAGALPLLDVPGIAFLVQSPVADPIELERQIELFLQNYRSTVAAISDAEFEKHRSGLLTRILQTEERLQDRSDRYWNELDLQHYRFDSRDRVAAAVRGLARADLIKFYDHALLGRERKLLIVRNVGKNHATGYAAKSPAVKEVFIAKPEEFGADLNFFSAAGPQTPAQDTAAAGNCAGTVSSC